MSFLGAAGHPVDVHRIWKNSREQVSCSTGLVLWRRSPLWLLARVVIQAIFSQSAGASEYYKEFMIFFIGRLLDLSREHDTSSDSLYCLACKISRRLLKLEPKVERNWLPTVEGILSRTVQLIEIRWKMIVETSDPVIQTSTLSTLNFREDTMVELP
jgi:hypothetical protein